MITLAIDTATKTAGVALLDDERVVAEYFFQLPVHHSETVLPALQRGLRLAALDIGDVGLIALTVGPGSFTGLRIGASTVKGLALAAGTPVPVVGVSTLEALAYNAAGFPGLVCPLLDARKGEVYGALYRADGEGFPETLMEERIGAPAEIVGRHVLAEDALHHAGARQRQDDMGEALPAVRPKVLRGAGIVRRQLDQVRRACPGGCEVGCGACRKHGRGRARRRPR